MSKPNTLVIDVGTSGVRAAVVERGVVGAVAYREVLADTPFPGLVELDAAALAAAVLEVANEALDAARAPVASVGIANQRATTVVWDRSSGVPVGPALGWQDLRTIGTCLEMRKRGLRLAPNASATKLANLLDQADPGRSADLCFGTIDSWVAWTLSGGRLHVTDATNAGVTGMTRLDEAAWDPVVLEALNIPASCLPAIVDSAGEVGECAALPGTPVLAGIAGDQQASLLGQSCVDPGQAKATFGTGGMLDCVTGTRPSFSHRGEGGCFPIIARQMAGRTTWGVEAIMLSAGSCIEWLRDDLGIVSSAEETEAIAASVTTTGEVYFVPAMLGLGTPQWDFGARGTLLGLTRGSSRAEIVRAVLEGVAHRGADLLEAAERDAGAQVEALRVDGGMSANSVFVQALADSVGRPVEISPQREATTLGAAYLAGLATGTWSSEDELAELWQPARVVEPRPSYADRERWKDAVGRSEAWIPALSELHF
ncbi:MAG: FGGY-family carbohydrate kinase [Acidimicrobiales bacterium]